jgi:hypothetical protein
LSDDNTRYSIQLIGERLSEVADDVTEVKGDVKQLGNRVYNLEIEAALARGVANATASRRSSTAHRVTVISGLCGALALFVTIFATVVHL